MRRADIHTSDGRSAKPVAHVWVPSCSQQAPVTFTQPSPHVPGRTVPTRKTQDSVQPAVHMAALGQGWEWGQTGLLPNFPAAFRIEEEKGTGSGGVGAGTHPPVARGG